MTVHLAEISEQPCFALLVDESADISKKEQLSLVLRTCNDDFDVRDDFIGIDEIEGLSADILYSHIADILLLCNLSGDKMVAVCFDGAAAMKSLADKMQNGIAPNAYYIHCVAHCNELIVKDICKVSNALPTAMSFCQSLYALVGAYPKRTLLFENIQREMQGSLRDSTTTLRIQSLSETRWTTRVKAIDVVIEKVQELTVALETLANDTSVTSECRAKAGGLLTQLSSYEEIFNLMVSKTVLVLIEKLSKELQAVDVTADYALFSVEHTKRRLDELRSDGEFDRVLEKVNQVSGVELPNKEIHRRRKIPRRFDDAVVTESLGYRGGSSNTQHELKRQYYATLDAASKSIGERFVQRGLFSIKCIETVLKNAAKSRKVSLENFECGLIDVSKLEVELQDLPTLFGLYNDQLEVKIKEITRIDTVVQMFKSIPSAKRMCPEVYKLIKIYLTIPLSSASCERSFSAMRRVKSWLRSSAGGQSSK